MTYPGDMTEPLIDRLASLAVEVARDTGYPLSDYVDKSDTELLDLVLRFEADAYGPAGPSELHPPPNGTVTIDLPDAVWATAEQMLDDGAALIVQAGGRTWVHHQGEVKQWGGDATPGV